MANHELAARLSETASVLHDLAVDHASIKGAFESHLRHCATDKAEIKDDIKSINTKIMAVLVFAILNLLALSSYLIVNDKPWVKEAQAENSK